jgi:hypothetical protein
MGELKETQNGYTHQPLTKGNPASWLSFIWAALGCWRDYQEEQRSDAYNEDGELIDPELIEEWNDICTAMAWIKSAVEQAENVELED